MFHSKQHGALTEITYKQTHWCHKNSCVLCCHVWTVSASHCICHGFLSPAVRYASDSLIRMNVWQCQKKWPYGMCLSSLHSRLVSLNQNITKLKEGGEGQGRKGWGKEAHPMLRLAPGEEEVVGKGIGACRYPATSYYRIFPRGIPWLPCTTFLSECVIASVEVWSICWWTNIYYL